jgi:hypothetical protein
MFTVALQSMLTRTLLGSLPPPSLAWRLAKMASVWGIFFRLGLEHRAQPVAMTVEDVRHRAWRGQHGVGEAALRERLQGRGGG